MRLLRPSHSSETFGAGGWRCESQDQTGDSRASLWVSLGPSLASRDGSQPNQRDLEGQGKENRTQAMGAGGNRAPGDPQEGRHQDSPAEVAR